MPHEAEQCIHEKAPDNRPTAVLAVATITVFAVAMKSATTAPLPNYSYSTALEHASGDETGKQLVAPARASSRISQTPASPTTSASDN